MTEQLTKGVTKICTLKVSYDWAIDNYSIYNEKIGDYIKSPIFPSSNNIMMKWYLKIYPKGKNKVLEDYVPIFLYCSKYNFKENIKVKANFSILNNKKEEFKSKELVYQYTAGKGRGLVRFIKRDDLLNKANNLLSNDKLIIRCYFQASTGSENFANKFEQKTDDTKYLEVCNNLKVILDNKELSDIIIVANGKELHAHQAILAARSPVFLAMLKHNMKEKTESKIEILDFDHEVLNEMLSYIYTGEVQNIKQHSQCLLTVADKYALVGLKIQCEKYLCNNITVNNATELFVLSDRHNCQTLKQQVINFISIHKKEVIESSAFESLKLSNPHLAINILSAIVLEQT